MYSDTRFGDLLKAFPRSLFNRLVRQHQSDKHAKGFSSWDHLVAMIFAQVSGTHSLRQLEAGFNTQESAHYHLGTRPIRKSTLSDANNQRHADLFRDVCMALLQQVHRKYRQDAAEFLYLMDSTPIPLKGYGYDWTQGKHTHRTHGLKVHIQLAAAQALPVDAQVAYANKNDIELGRETVLEKGATYVFDKGYYDYNWWYKIHQAGAVFVTRIKENAAIKTVRSLGTPQGSDVVSDDVITLKNKHPGGHRVNHYYGHELRKVVIRRPDHDKDIVLVTNDFNRSAQAIGDLYKSRWGIELFFKWLKQNLRIKRFLGRSENAVRIQIFTALIAYLLAHIRHQVEGGAQALSLWLVELRTQLFTRHETRYAMNKRRRQELMKLRQLQSELPLKYYSGQ